MLTLPERKYKLTTELDRLISRGCRILYHSGDHAQVEDVNGKAFNVHVDEDGVIHTDPLKRNAEPAAKKPPGKKKVGCLPVVLVVGGVIVGLVVLIGILGGLGVLDDSETDQINVATPRPTVVAAKATPYFDPTVREPIPSSGGGSARDERIAEANEALWELAQDDDEIEPTSRPIATTESYLSDEAITECRESSAYLRSIEDSFGEMVAHSQVVATLFGDGFGNVRYSPEWRFHFNDNVGGIEEEAVEILLLRAPPNLQHIDKAAKEAADISLDAMLLLREAVDYLEVERFNLANNRIEQMTEASGDVWDIIGDLPDRFRSCP